MNYKQRQKILNEIMQTLDIDFNKISVYSSVIEIHSHSHDPSAEFKVILKIRKRQVMKRTKAIQ